MAKLNLNLMLSNVAVNAVVAERMGRGSKLGAEQALATPSLGWPVYTGPEPKPDTRGGLRLDFIERETIRERAGRSVVSPNAGEFVSCHAWHARQALALQATMQLADKQDFMSRPFASDVRTTSAR